MPWLPLYVIVSTYFALLVNVILFTPLNVKSMSENELDTVDASILSAVANALPVGLLSVPNAVIWVSSYIETAMLPVTDPTFLRYNFALLSVPPSPVNDCPTDIPQPLYNA